MLEGLNRNWNKEKLCTITFTIAQFIENPQSYVDTWVASNYCVNTQCALLSRYFVGLSARKMPMSIIHVYNASGILIAFILSYEAKTSILHTIPLSTFDTNSDTTYFCWWRKPCISKISYLYRLKTLFVHGPMTTFVFHSMWLTGFYKVIRLKTEHVSNHQSGDVKFPPDRDV